MTNTKHTPAPWFQKINTETNGHSYIQIFSDAPSIIDSSKTHIAAVPRRLVDDARLIAAAPKLLEAAKRMCNAMNADDELEIAYANNDLAAAIAKATGN